MLKIGWRASGVLTFFWFIVHDKLQLNLLGSVADPDSVLLDPDQTVYKKTHTLPYTLNRGVFRYQVGSGAKLVL